MPAPFTLFRVGYDDEDPPVLRSTEVKIKEKIDFYRLHNLIDFDHTGEDLVIPDKNTKLIAFQPMVGRFRSRNPAPFADATVKQDVGFEGIRFHLTMLFNEQGLPNGVYAAGRRNLLRWSIQRSTIRELYPHGTIGMRNDWSPEFNITPSDKAGLKITSYQYLQELGMPYLTRGEIILEFSGDPKEVWFNE